MKIINTSCGYRLFYFKETIVVHYDGKLNRTFYIVEQINILGSLISWNEIELIYNDSIFDELKYIVKTK